MRRHRLWFVVCLLVLSTSLRAMADDSLRCWSASDGKWRPCSIERTTGPRAALGSGARGASAPSPASTVLAGRAPSARLDGRAVLSPVLADSAELCNALRTPVLPEQRFVRSAGELVQIAELDAERRRCLTTSLVDELHDAVPVLPGLTYHLNTKLADEAGTILVANYGALLTLVRNGVGVAARPIDEPWIAIPYEPGDVVQAVSRHEALLVPFTFVRVEALGSGAAPEPSDDVTWRGSSSRVVGPPVRQPASRSLDVALRLECHSREPASASVVWGFVRDGIEMPVERLSAGPSEVAPCDGSVLTLRRRVELPPGALSRILEPYARVVAPDRAEAGMIVVAASSIAANDGEADSDATTFGDPVPAAPATPPLLAAPDELPTGLIPPDAEDLRWMEENLETTLEVRLTPLGAERIAPLLGVTARSNLDASTTRPADDDLLDAVESLLGSSTLALDAPLPAAVDNSRLPSFPEIRSQGSLGSCAAFASTYYLMTHEHCLVDGCAASGSDDGTKFSPKFTYNLINDGEDGGSWITTAFSVMLDHGAPTWEEFPYVGSRSDPLNYRGWMTDVDAWTTALPRRMNEAGEIRNLDTSEGLALLKQKLLNGHVLNIATYVNSWKYTTLSDDPSTSEDDATVGEEVVKFVNGTNGAHAMTVVGYDDTVWTDLNGNEIVDPGEKGALKIANSWGSWWRESGFVWFSYDALLAASAVDGVADDPSRRQGFWYDQAYWMTARDDYEPSAVAEITLQHAKRNQMRVYVGVSDVGASTPTDPLYSSAIYWNGGAYAFDGSSTASDASFALDLTDLVETGNARRWFAVISDWTSGNAATVQDVTIRDLQSRQQRGAAGLPTAVDDDTLYVHADLAIGSGVPQVITPGQDVSSWLDAHQRARRQCAAFSLDLPCGAGELDVTLRELSGDAELLVSPSWMGDPCRRNAVARCVSSNAGSADETCTMTLPDPGTWLIGVRNVDTDAAIDFTLSTSVIETDSPRPLESLRFDEATSSWCWTPAPSCETREPATRFELYATTASEASFGSAPGFGETYVARLQAAPWCLPASLVATPPSGDVTMVEVVGENEDGKSETLP